MIPCVGVEEHLAVHLCTLGLDLQTVTLDRSITEAYINLIGTSTVDSLVVHFTHTCTELILVDIHLHSPLCSSISLVEILADIMSYVELYNRLDNHLVKNEYHYATRLEDIGVAANLLETEGECILLTAILELIVVRIDGECSGVRYRSTGFNGHLIGRERECSLRQSCIRSLVLGVELLESLSIVHQLEAACLGSLFRQTYVDVCRDKLVADSKFLRGIGISRCLQDICLIGELVVFGILTTCEGYGAEKDATIYEFRYLFHYCSFYELNTT